MDQVKFMLTANNIHPEGDIIQQPDGIVVVNMRPTIQITHNYKKKNQMQIIFVDTNDTYIIPDQQTLEEIYQMHLSNTNVVEILLKYCNKNLKKLNN